MRAFRRSIQTRALLVGLIATVLVASTALATVGQNRTDGPRYDRNPSVVSTAGLTYLFFARSQQPCDRLAGCNPDVALYDLYVKVSTDGGKDFGPPQLVAVNPLLVPPFYGRTIAVTVAPDGTLRVFWASGGNCSLLYVVTGTPTATPVFSAPTVVPGSFPLTFNVEAVTRSATTYLYTEECNVPYGIYAYSYDGANATGKTLVSADKNLPKGIVDNQTGVIRLAYTDASAYPTVDVLVNTSADGLVFAAEQLVVSEPGVSHWDPQLVQKPNGQFELHYAPDREQGAGSQRIGVTRSNDFVRWTTPHEITPGQKGGVEYWDYWPEAVLRGNQVVLYYTSERQTKTRPTGTGHIWTNPGLGGTD